MANRVKGRQSQGDGKERKTKRRNFNSAHNKNIYLRNQTGALASNIWGKKEKQSK